MRIDIIRPSGDLERQRWCFCVHESYGKWSIDLDTYAHEFRESKRHRTWTAPNGAFHRTRPAYHWVDSRIPGSEVSLPDDVLAEVKTTVLNALTLQQPKAHWEK
jgi:hypothetical protein